MKADIRRNRYDNFECPDDTCEIYRQIFDSTRQLIVILDNDLTITYANLALLEYLDMKRQDIVGREYWDLPIWSHSIELQNKIMFAMEGIYLGENVKFETTHKDKNDNIRDIDFEIKAVLDHESNIRYLIAMGYDVTEIKETRSELRKKEEDLKTFFKYSIEGYLIRSLDEHIYIDYTHLRDVFNYIMDHEKVSDYNKALINVLNIDDFKVNFVLDILFEDLNTYFLLWKKSIRSASATEEIRVNINGVEKIFELNLIPSIDDTGRYFGVFLVLKDVTERVRLIEKMTYLATKDSLTGINNRRHYLHESKKAINKYSDRNIYIAMLDIDNFKNINDSYGHDIGDIVIRKLAQSLETHFYEDSLVGRMGGEEFAICVYKENTDIRFVLEKLRSSIENFEIKVENQCLRFTVSIGYAKLPASKDIEEALKYADKALYTAKHRGKNRVEGN